MQCQKHEKGAAVLNDHEKNHLKWATRAPHVRLTCASCVAVTCYETTECVTAVRISCSFAQLA